MLPRIGCSAIATFACGCGLLLDVGATGEDDGMLADGARADAARIDGTPGDASANDAPSSDASVDAIARDAGSGPCLEWGPFEEPTEVVAVNTTAQEYSPTLTADNLEMFFTSARGGNQDLWVARRTSAGEPFGAPEPVAELNTTEAEQDPDITPDGLAILFSRDGGGILEAKRETRSDAFARPVQLEITFDGGDEPALYGGANLADASTLYFSAGAYRPPLHDLFVATRPAGAGPWSASRLDVLNTSEHEGFPSISSDQLELYFDARRHVVDLDVFVVRRATIADPWGDPGLASAVPGASDLGPSEQDPDISPDGSMLCFDVNAGAGGAFDFDIWCMQRACMTRAR